MRDALFGLDGTQAPPPPPTYPDALSGPVRRSERVAVPVPQEVTPAPARVKASKSSTRARKPATETRRRPAAATQTGTAPAPYSSPQRVGPARRVSAAPKRRRTGAAVTGWLIALLIFGSLAFNVLQGLLRELGVLH